MVKCFDCGEPVPFIRNMFSTLNNLCADCAVLREQGNSAVDHHVYQLDTPNGVRTVSVKNGFNWPSFFFGALWAWSKGLVAIGFGLLFLAVGYKFLDTLLWMQGPVGGLLSFFIGLGILAWVGTRGNMWVANSLKEKGYKLASAAASEETIEDST